MCAGLLAEACGGAKEEGPAEAAHDMAWEQLHTGAWHSVPLVWRDAFSLSCLCLASHCQYARQLDQALRYLDLGVMMGGPLFRSALDAAIVSFQDTVGNSDREEHLIRLGAEGHEENGGPSDEEGKEAVATPTIQNLNISKQLKRKQGTDWSEYMEERSIVGELHCEEGEVLQCHKRSCTEEICSDVHEDTKLSSSTAGDVSLGQHWNTSHLAVGVDPPEVLECLPHGSLQCKFVEKQCNPSLEEFLCNYFLPGLPVIVTDAMSHWPALTKWNDFKYLQKIAGNRTIPVEVGEHYLAEGWRQELMTLSQLMERWHTRLGCSSKEQLYLAQHPLFDQIPQLRSDIVIPDYCSVGGGELHSINAWLGPAGTITPLHHDPHHNFLAQVVGRKYVRLYSHQASECLYPYAEAMLCNSSQVDLNNPDNEQWPEAQDLKFVDCILEEGQMLYIPPKWWHYVQSLSPSFSVSFWWTTDDNDNGGHSI
ncbi:hypothetical protein CY35_14G025900 [Sphagnum magellanicum]|nr:hypothetical protein CY35_14G025900 [Sphagnum magellanicum]